jgi:Tfp pilus assembly protein PilO
MGFRSWTGFGIILAICALLLVGNAAFLRPAHRRLHEVNGALAVSKNETAYLKSNPGHFELMASFLPEKTEEGTGGEQRLLSKISELIKGAGMVMTEVEPGKVSAQGPYTRREFKVEAQGNFREFARLLRDLETMRDVVIINSFELVSGTLRRQSDDSAVISLTVIGY